MLEKCSTKWDRRYAKTLLSLPHLKNLCISSYGEKDFTTLSQNKSITEVRIIRSSIESFHGIGAMSKLTKLWMQLTTNLKTFDAIQEATELKVLQVEDAKKVESCESIGQLEFLEYLTLVNAGGLSNLDSLYSLQALKGLSLPGVLLVNIDWSRLIAMPSLEYFLVLFVKDIKPSEEQLREYAASCNKKIENMEWQGTRNTPALKLKLKLGA